MNKYDIVSNLVGPLHLNRILRNPVADNTYDLGASGSEWKNLYMDGVVYVGGTQVISARVVDDRCNDAVNSGDATTDGVIDALRDAMIAHGLIAAA